MHRQYKPLQTQIQGFVSNNDTSTDPIINGYTYYIRLWCPILLWWYQHGLSQIEAHPYDLQDVLLFPAYPKVLFATDTNPILTGLYRNNYTAYSWPYGRLPYLEIGPPCLSVGNPRNVNYIRHNTAHYW